MICMAILPAMYKGDSRTRSMEVYAVDGDGNREIIASWTSSGTTTAFERLEFEAQAQAIELQGVLDDSEWISIMEVRSERQLQLHSSQIRVKRGYAVAHILLVEP